MSFPQLQQPAIGPTLASAGTPKRRIVLTVFDSDLLAEAVRDADFKHRQLHRGSFRGELIRAEIGALTVDRGCYSQTLLARGSFSPTRITIGFLLSDREPGCINGIRSRAHDLIIFPEGGELDYVLPAATEWCSVQFERDALLAAGIPAENIARMSVVSPQAGQHSRLVRLMRSAVDGHVCRQEQDAFRDILLENLYQALDPQGGQRRHPNFYRCTDLLRRFERLVDEQGAKRRSIPELAQALGVGRRTLEQVFRDYVGLSPARYVAVLRFNAMRRELLHGSEDNLCVSGLAERHGVVHLGRFAADYRRMFGELPSQTLRRARRHASPA